MPWQCSFKKICFFAPIMPKATLAKSAKAAPTVYSNTCSIIYRSVNKWYNGITFYTYIYYNKKNYFISVLVFQEDIAGAIMLTDLTRFWVEFNMTSKINQTIKIERVVLWDWWCYCFKWSLILDWLTASWVRCQLKHSNTSINTNQIRF